MYIWMLINLMIDIALVEDNEIDVMKLTQPMASKPFHRIDDSQIDF